MYSVCFDDPIFDARIFIDGQFLCNILNLEDFKYSPKLVYFGIQVFKIRDEDLIYEIKHEGIILTYRILPVENIREIFQEILEKRDGIQKGDTVKIRDDDWEYAQRILPMSGDNNVFKVIDKYDKTVEVMSSRKISKDCMSRRCTYIISEDVLEKID